MEICKGSTHTNTHTCARARTYTRARAHAQIHARAHTQTKQQQNKQTKSETEGLSVLTVTPGQKKDPNGSAEKGPEVIAQTQRAVVKAAVPLLYTVLS